MRVSAADAASDRGMNMKPELNLSDLLVRVERAHVKASEAIEDLQKVQTALLEQVCDPVYAAECRERMDAMDKQ